MKRKKRKVSIGIIVMFILTLIGVSFAWWTNRAIQQSINKIVSDCIAIEIEDVNNSAINLEQAYPITDREAELLTPYTFKIKNICNSNTEYEIRLEIMDLGNDQLKSEYLALDFNGEGKRILNQYASVGPTYNESDYVANEARHITSGVLQGKEEKTYSLRIWMDESVTSIDAMNKEFVGKIIVIGEMSNTLTYKEELLNGADPVLADNLIPITIDNSGVVRKANEKEEWYSYAKKQWANAVILEDESVTYNVNDIIPEENIESYFVWIPKYSYQLWDLGEYESLSTIDESKAHEIPVRFGLTDTSDSKAGECTTPMNEERTQGLSGESGNCKVGDYMTHPAFISMNTNGLWVGKFESGYKGASGVAEAQVNEVNSEKLQIKPNVYSWRKIQVSNAHLTSYNYKRELDSHMMKNTEWGAVAYLQHSFYGSGKNVRINNNNSYITGYANVNVPVCGWTGTNEECNKYESTALGVDGNYTSNYKNPSSQVASTTGNYSGIYDMSGGAWEYMMGVMSDQEGAPASGRHNLSHSGFNGTLNCPDCTDDGMAVDSTILSVSGKVDFPERKYYDIYKYNELEAAYNYRILGDATAEMGPFETINYASKDRKIGSWHLDGAVWILYDMPWIRRGGSYNFGSEAGLLSFSKYRGAADAWYSFRVVLAIK